MARRRTSPAFDSPQDSSESDNALSGSSGDEFFLDEEDPQTLLQQTNSVWSSLWSRFRKDPHAPKAIPLSRRQARRQRRRQRRTERRLTRRGQKLDTESSTLYEADGADVEYKDDDRSLLSEDDDWENLRPRPQGRSGARRWTRILLLSVLGGLSVVAALFFIVSLLSRHDTNTQTFPVARPKVLYNNGSSNFGPTTILISLDGFRADFLDLGITPALASFVSGGVSPKFMLPSFPSVTFPNHWTLVTGLHPESHGIVGNSFWDQDLGEEFYYTDPARSMFPKWWTSTGAEPLWTTAERQGIRSAVHMWPGSEAGIQPAPFYLDQFSAQEKLSRKVDSVLAWLDLPGPFDMTGVEVDVTLKTPRPQFISMYVPDIDRDGHKFGPNTTQVRSTVSEVDGMLSQLLSGLESRNLSSIVNVVVVSDHGMASTSRERLVQLEDLVDVDQIERIHGWPLYGLRPKAGVDLQKLYDGIKAKWSAAGPTPGWTVHTLQTMPERWHFTANPRIAPIFLIPDAGWSIVTKKEMDLADPANVDAVYHPKGIHGYDNEHPLMRAIFAARGPAFPHPPGSRVKTFQNTEVYNIVCQSLGVSPMKNNGTLSFPLSTEGPETDAEHESDVSEGDHAVPGAPDINNGTKAEQPAPSPGQDATELAKAKAKLQGLWDKLRQGFGKLKGWFGDTFGGKGPMT